MAVTEPPQPDGIDGAALALFPETENVRARGGAQIDGGGGGPVAHIHIAYIPCDPVTGCAGGGEKQRGLPIGHTIERTEIDGVDAALPDPLTVHASRSARSARSARPPHPPPAGPPVVMIGGWTSVAGLVDGSRKKSLACPASTQLVTSRIGIFGKPTFPPLTTATAVPPVVPPHRAVLGTSTLASTSPTAPTGTASASPAIVPMTTDIANPRATHLMRFLPVRFIVSTLSPAAWACSVRELDTHQRLSNWSSALALHATSGTPPVIVAPIELHPGC